MIINIKIFIVSSIYHLITRKQRNPIRQGKVRPVLIIQNNRGNKHSPTTIVACLSSKIYTKHHLPTHCILPDGLGLKYRSMVMCEQIRVIDKSRLFKKIATLNKRQMAIIDKKIKISLDLRLHNPKK